MNYFELFKIPLSLRVDNSTLAQTYFELQKQFHPDFFAQGTEYEQAEALEQSSRVNQALKIFRNEDETIKYVLQLKGLLEEEEKYQLPPAFLMEMMEINEALTETGEEVVIKNVSDHEKTLFEEISPVIKNYDPAKTAPEDLLKLKAYYYKKKYLKRILDRLVD